MTVYIVAQLSFTDRAAYDRYQARFMDVFRKFEGRLLAAYEHPMVLEGHWQRTKWSCSRFPTRARADALPIRSNIRRSRAIATLAPTP